MLVCKVRQFSSLRRVRPELSELNKIYPHREIHNATLTISVVYSTRKWPSITCILTQTQTKLISAQGTRFNRERFRWQNRQGLSPQLNNEIKE